MSLLRWITASIVALLMVPLMAPVGAQPSPMQQMFVLGEVHPDMERVGIIWTEDAPEHDDVMDGISRASANSDVEIYVFYAESVSDVAPGYRELRSEHGAEAIWVVDEQSAASEETAREYLIENTVRDGVPLLAPSEQWVSAGATMSIQASADGDINLVVNEQAAGATGLTVPDDYQEDMQSITSR